jgi:hypothetical protein
MFLEAAPISSRSPSGKRPVGTPNLPHNYSQFSISIQLVALFPLNYPLNPQTSLLYNFLVETRGSIPSSTDRVFSRS